MGACCTKDHMFGGSNTYDKDERDSNGGDDGEEVRRGDDGATVRLRGSSVFTSMYTQRGRKGINQDTMTVWEDFSGEKDLVFCGVFDGHGPSGHRVAHNARDQLPSKLSKAIKKRPYHLENGVSEAYVQPDNNGGNQPNPFASRESICWLQTWVTPGRFSDADYPGLAMSRSLGDFCLKDYGVIPTPQFSTKLQIWDVLTNKQVINIVASSRNRSMAAKLVVKLAVREWKHRFPGSMIDDCTVICLFFKNPQMLTKSMTSVGRRSVRSHPELVVSRSCRSMGIDRKRGEEEGRSAKRESKEDMKAVNGLNRANSQTRIPRFTKTLSHNQKTAKLFHEVEAR